MQTSYQAAYGRPPGPSTTPSNTPFGDEDYAYAVAVDLQQREDYQALQQRTKKVEEEQHLTWLARHREDYLKAKGQPSGEDALSPGPLLIRSGPQTSARDTITMNRLSSFPSQQLSLASGLRAPSIPGSSISARQLVLQRLKEVCMIEKECKGDGACQFRSLSDQLYGTPAYHMAVRDRVVDHIRANPQAYAGYCPLPFEEYCRDMRRKETWGDNLTLQAAADLYGRRIVVITSFPDHYVVAIEPASKLSSRILYLSFWAEDGTRCSALPSITGEAMQLFVRTNPTHVVEAVTGFTVSHYNSLYMEDEEHLATSDKAPKLFGSKKLGQLLEPPAPLGSGALR